LNFSGVKPAEYSGGRIIQATRDLEAAMNHPALARVATFSPLRASKVQTHA
jgi:hypothetical protein